MEIDWGVLLREFLSGWRELSHDLVYPVAWILWAGRSFGLAANAAAIRERAGTVLLDVGRPTSSKVGTTAWLGFWLVWFLCSVATFSFWGESLRDGLWAVASVLVLTSHVALMRVGFVGGRLEVATNGLLMNGRELLRWENIRSWKWREDPSSVLVVFTGAHRRELRVSTGMVRQFPIPEQLEAQVNRLLMEYRGNGPYPPENASTINAAQSA